ncbi:MAG: hypothetical protein ACRDYA_09045 [Egibacteraceae bacterium]
MLAEVVSFAIEPASRLVDDLSTAGEDAHEAAHRIAAILDGAGRDDVSGRLELIGEWAQEVADGLAWRLRFIQQCDANYLPIQAVTADGMTTFVIPFDSKAEADAHAAGAARMTEIRRRLADGDIEGAEGLLNQVEGHADDQAWMGGFMRMLGPDGIDSLEAEFKQAIEAKDKPRGGPFGWALDLLEGTWESITGTLGVLRDLTVQVVYDSGGWAEDWSALGTSLWEGCTTRATSSTSLPTSTC